MSLYTLKRILTAAVRAFAVSAAWEAGERVAKRYIPLKPKPSPKPRKRRSPKK